MDIDRYHSFLERVLTPQRLEHSLSVMEVMGELADVYALDRDQALTAGLLHDAAKDLTPDQQAEIVAEAKIEICDASEQDYLHYLHGPVGAHFVQRELGITDPLILDAIATHTYYGNSPNFHAPLCWCVRFSDILEPTRNWNNVQWLKNGFARFRDVVYAGRLKEAALLETGWLIRWFEGVGVPIHPNMKRVYGELAEQLKVDGSFLE